jgi:hypothetical protein
LKFKATVYLVTVEHSSSLRCDCGAFEILGVFSSFERALSVAKEWKDKESSCGYIPADEEILTSNSYILTTYKGGDEDSDLWSELRINSYVINEGFAMQI